MDVKFSTHMWKNAFGLFLEDKGKNIKKKRIEKGGEKSLQTTWE